MRKKNKNETRLQPRLSMRLRLAISAAATIIYVVWLLLIVDVTSLRWSVGPALISCYLMGLRGLFLVIAVNCVNVLAIHYSGGAKQGIDPMHLFGLGLTLFVATLVGQISDLNRKVIKLNNELAATVLVDPLTSLHNRRFAEVVATETAQSFLEKKTTADVKKRDSDLDGQVMGICMLDVDHFKKINDTYGHRAGDKVLISTSKILKDNVRFDDMVLRWGGEEFVILLVATKPGFMTSFADKIRSSVEKNEIQLDDGKRIKVTVSLGITVFPLADKAGVLSFDQCLNLSDVAMYHAKQTGRNRAVMFDPDGPFTYNEILNEESKQEHFKKIA
jgi:diguanylate cyclase (GGDEF)-like protein